MRNRQQLAHTLKQRRLRLFAVTIVLIVIGFLGLQPAARPNPGRLAAQALRQAPLKSLPLTLKKTPEELNQQLTSLGISQLDETMSLDELAAQIHQPGNWLLIELLDRK
jgi:hypothetical protein